MLEGGEGVWEQIRTAIGRGRLHLRVGGGVQMTVSVHAGGGRQRTVCVWEEEVWGWEDG